MLLQGTAVSRGVAVGRVFIHKPFSVTVKESYFPAEQLEAQKARYEQTVARVEAELRGIREKLEKSDPEKAAILKAHLEILFDDAMTEEIADCIEKEHCVPDWAVEKIYSMYIALLDEVEDPLIKERAADLRDVRRRILRNWYNVCESDLTSLAEESVIAAYDLLPSDTATLDRSKVLAIVTEIGGATSHTAIIARSYNIPAVVGIPNLMNSLENGQEAAVDAIEGVVVVNPSDADKTRFAVLREEHIRKMRVIEQFLHAKPLTADGERVDIGLNIGSGSDDALASIDAADFVGLFRTEFLYMEKPGLPGEDEQFAIYKKVLDRCNPRPVTIRTLDVGGDKKIDCIDMPAEDNPFLGNRALRLCFSRRDIFRTQLRALLRASVYGNLWLMLPMVASIDDIRRAKEIIDEVKRELDAEFIPYSKSMKIGIMIEIPSIAVIADLAAREVDFASIGTNDLCQYLTAVDRLNPAVADYYQSYHPAMFRMIGNIVERFAAAGKPVSVCGEMGGDEMAAAVLVGLGLRKLSMGPNSVANVKCMLSRLSSGDAKTIADVVANFSTAAEVEGYLKKKVVV